MNVSDNITFLYVEMSNIIGQYNTWRNKTRSSTIYTRKCFRPIGFKKELSLLFLLPTKKFQ